MTEQIARSVKDTAAALGMPYYRVLEHVKAGRLNGYRDGNRYYVLVSDAEEFMRSLPAGTTSPADD